MISHIDHLVLTVSDIERAVAFYSRAFKMEPITFGAGRRALRFGNQKINLQQGPVMKSGACGPIESVYCLDPDQNLVEISRYR